jgi:hypothetical protein
MSKPPLPPRLASIDRSQLVLHTIDVEHLIGEDHSARSVWELVGRLNLSLYHAEIAAVARNKRRDAHIAPYRRHPHPTRTSILISPSRQNQTPFASNRRNNQFFTASSPETPRNTRSTPSIRTRDPRAEPPRILPLMAEWLRRSGFSRGEAYEMDRG